PVARRFEISFERVPDVIRREGEPGIAERDGPAILRFARRTGQGYPANHSAGQVADLANQRIKDADIKSRGGDLHVLFPIGESFVCTGEGQIDRQSPFDAETRNTVVYCAGHDDVHSGLTLTV